MGRERFKVEGMFENYFKNIVFLEFSGSVLESKRAFRVHNGKMGCSYHSRTNSKNSPSKPWEIEHLSSFVPIFHLFLPKFWQDHPHKNYIVKINNYRSVTSKNFRVLKLKIVDSGSIWNWVIFDHIFIRNGKKHLVDKWLSWLLKRIKHNYTLLNWNFFDTFHKVPRAKSQLNSSKQDMTI